MTAERAQRRDTLLPDRYKRFKILFLYTIATNKFNFIKCNTFYTNVTTLNYII